MKLKLLLMLIFYGSSVYALQTAYWDNFLKSFNDYKSQVSITCKAQEKLNDENENLPGDKLYLDEKDIQLAWWGIQKDKAKGARLLNQIDGITSDEVMESLLKNQNKNDDLKKKELQKITPLLNSYIGNVIDGIKKGKALAKAYGDLMGAADDAPPSLQRQKESFMGCPTGIQVSLNWKKKAEDMIKNQCLKECSKVKDFEDKNNCEKHFEFREGAAAYLADLKKRKDLCTDTIRVYRCFDSMALYSEMKEEMVNLLEENRALVSSAQGCKTRKSDNDTLKKQYENKLEIYKSNLKKCDDKLSRVQEKAKKLKSAVEQTVDMLNVPSADYKKTVEDLKLIYDELFPPKPASSKP